MKLETIAPAKGATKNRKRVGRGQGSGRGGTSTRGTKGAQARAGYEHKIGFEGGQMPIQRRLPKFGFKNPTRIEFKAVNVPALEALAAALGKNELGIEDIVADETDNRARKVLIDGVLYIIRDGRIYNATGQEVR